MDLHHFLSEVEGRIGHRVGDLQGIVDAVLATVAEHLTPGEAANLRAQLPDRLQEPLVRGGAEPFDWHELCRRVAARAGVDEPLAAVAAAAVLDVLREAVDPSTFTRFLDQLPASFPTTGDPIAPIVRGRAAARWRPGDAPGEWVIESPSGHRGTVRRVGAGFEARVWRRQTGPAPGPALEPSGGPRAFDRPEDALGYVEANVPAT